MAGWNAALCEECWYDVAGDRMPVRVKAEVGYPWETCSRCGMRTCSGIYRRIAPQDQNFYTPSEESVT